jgi:redox-sensitive bicupin YhaK (pirin superfamily)
LANSCFSPIDADNALWINQDARFSLTNLENGKEITYTTAFKNNGVFLVVINGSVEVSGQQLKKRDALGISETESFTVIASEDAELLAIEIPMN